MENRPPRFGEQLRALRLRSGLSQEALAERAGLGTAAIAALERGSRRAPYPSTLGALATSLGLSAEERAAFVDAARRYSAPPAAVRRGRPRLAAPLTQLVGREADLTAGRALLNPSTSDVRLLTIVGAGGVGKTALGLQVACDLQHDLDAAWRVELAPIADGALVAETVAVALGVPERASGSPLDPLVEFLGPTTGLLVLDNCEHVLDACLDLATFLLVGCPNLRILATSREPLQVPGEHVLRLSALTAPEPDEVPGVAALSEYAAVQLFVERIRAFDHSFELTSANAAAVTQVCARLEGIPLALELAAARLQVLTLHQLVARLDHVFSILGSGSRAAPTRQQTMRATLDWSYELLTEAEQAVFRRLAVVAGSCDLEAAEAFCRTDDVTDADVLDVLARLANKSLVLVAGGSLTARYRLLEPVRQYAEQLLVASGEAPRAHARHAAWYLALAERAQPELTGPDQTAWLERLDLERDNLRASVRWLREAGDADGELRLVTALAPYWEARGLLKEGRRSLEAALAAPWSGPASPVRRRDALQAAGELVHWQADLDAAQVYLEESLRLSQELHDAAGVAEALTLIGTLARRRGQHADSAALLEESVATQRALGNSRGLARVLLSLGVTVGYLGDLARARSLLEESLALFRERGDVRNVAFTLTMLANCVTASGDLEAGALLHAEGLLGHRRASNLGTLHFALGGLAEVAAARAQPVRAVRLLGASEAARESVGAAHALINRATRDRLLGKLRQQLGEAAVTAAFAAGYALSLDDAIDEALADVLPAAGPSAMPSGGARPGSRLTPREREVVELLVRGCSDREIAEALSISVATAGVHVHHLLRKLELRSRWQVADWAASQSAESERPMASGRPESP